MIRPLSGERRALDTIDECSAHLAFLKDMKKDRGINNFKTFILLLEKNKNIIKNTHVCSVRLDQNNRCH
jgi:hypothetical protein